MATVAISDNPYSWEGQNSSLFVNSSTFADNLTFLAFSYNSGHEDSNDTDNGTLGPRKNPVGHHRSPEIIVTVVTSALLGLVILATMIGNVSVIVAILRERNLQTVGNCLVLSLAVADLLVALLVMPLGAVYEVSREWTMGPELCDVWTSCDVLCCTASILHLLAIAVDRYWAVTNIDYVRQRKAWHIGSMIILVWVAAFVVSFAPIFGWKDPDYWKRIEDEKRCLVSQDVAYQLFATCATFYVPLVVILFLYWRIYQVARKRIRRRPGGGGGGCGGNVAESRLMSAAILAPLVSEMTVISTTTTSSYPSSDPFSSSNGIHLYQNDVVTKPILARARKKQRKIVSLKSKKERKAAKTLAIITGIFVVCWLPFFVIALLMPLCSTCEPNDYLFSFALWLGYANSMVNPIVYTIFSPDFRTAFKRMLCGQEPRTIW